MPTRRPSPAFEERERGVYAAALRILGELAGYLRLMARSRALDLARLR